MKTFSVILLCLCLYACDSAEKKEVVVEEEPVSPYVLKDEIAKLSYTDYVLDAKAESDIDGWQPFEELNDVMLKLKEGDLSYFQGDTKTMQSLMVGLVKDIPAEINAPAIRARFLTLETKMLKLQSVLELRNIPKEEQLKNVEETLIAYSNLNLQINKKYEKDAQNIQKP